MEVAATMGCAAGKELAVDRLARGGERVFAEHGRGIYLINQLMDEVTFTRGGTEIRMRKD